MLQVILIIAGIVLLIALTKRSNSKKNIEKETEKDNSLKRSLELELLIKQAQKEGLSTTEYESELARLKESRRKAEDPAYKYIS